MSQYKHYSRSSTHALFDRILASLPSSLTQPHPPTTKDLAKLTEKLQRFQQSLFDPKARPIDTTQPFPRIPTKLFKNYTPNGPLQRIIHSAYSFRVRKGIRKWDIDNPAKRDVYTEMLRTIAEDLKEQGLIIEPVLTFAPSVSLEVRAELAPLATLMRAAVVPHMTAKVTHVIQHAEEHGEDGEDNGQQEWYRTLEKRDGYVLLHYWYKPDSEDVWVAESSGDYLDPEPAPLHTGPWYLSIRWLRDSISNYQWMNEEDYEAETPEHPDAAGLGGNAGETAMGEEEDSDGSLEADDDGEDDEEGDEDAEEDEDEDEDDEDDDEDDMKSRKSHSHIGSPDRPINLDIDDDDDMMSFAGSATGHRRDGRPQPKPHVKPVDLDRKGVRAKRYEYEPFQDSIIHNISHTWFSRMPKGTSYTGDRTPSVEQTWSFLPVESKPDSVKTQLPNPPAEAATKAEDDPMNVDVKNEPKTEPVNAESGLRDVDSKDVPKPELTDSAAIPPTEAPIAPVEPPSYTETPAELATYQIVNLSNAPWFSFDAVHDIEKTQFPEFFPPAMSSIYPSRSTRNEASYLRIRNALVMAFRRNMTRYLTISEAMRYLRPALLEDVCKIHRFLTHWGLINLQVRESAPTGVTLLEASRLYDAFSMDKEASEPPVDPQSYVYSSAITQPTKSESVSSSSPPNSAAPPSHHLQHQCEMCRLKISPTSPHFVLAQPPHIVLCHPCFVTGRFPVDLSSYSFARVDPPYLTTSLFPSRETEPTDIEKWSPRETLKLLDAISESVGHEKESYKSDPDDDADAVDWTRIANMFTNPRRSPAECMAHFITLRETPDISLLALLDTHSPPLSAASSWIYSAQNPLMVFIAAVSAAVNPGIAAAAAKQVMKSLNALNLDAGADQQQAHLQQQIDLVKKISVETAAPAARQLAVAEDRELAILARALADSQIKKLALKMGALKGAM
ncbi:hypothetical protein DFJ77DRAFT_161046 [Powellomyces hirtus]|nr:hypothetical protein DFJ77DRAFT_161046 [Powellomyces hirtus]